MTERPLLMRTCLVLQVKARRKNQTRRLLRVKGMDSSEIASVHLDGSGRGWIAWSPHAVSAEQTTEAYPGNEGFPCPYGVVGDRLWIKEKHYLYGSWRKSGFTKTGKQKYRFIKERGRGVKFPDCPPETICTRKDQTGWFARSSLFMPRWASRLTIEITDIRVQRLQDITEEEAIAEGCLSTARLTEDGSDYTGLYAFEHFAELWDEINGEGAWERNDWVFALTFKEDGAT